MHFAFAICICICFVFVGQLKCIYVFTSKNLTVTSTKCMHSRESKKKRIQIQEKLQACIFCTGISQDDFSSNQAVARVYCAFRVPVHFEMKNRCQLWIF